MPLAQPDVEATVNLKLPGWMARVVDPLADVHIAPPAICFRWRSTKTQFDLSDRCSDPDLVIERHCAVVPRTIWAVLRRVVRGFQHYCVNASYEAVASKSIIGSEPESLPLIAPDQRVTQPSACSMPIIV